MAKRKLSISFKEKYTDVYDYLMQLREQNENISDYICRLIENDIKNEQRDLQDEIRKFLLDTILLNPSILSHSAALLDAKPHDQKLTNEDVDLLNQLF